jgi:hypothetical protein
MISRRGSLVSLSLGVQAYLLVEVGNVGNIKLAIR